MKAMILAAGLGTRLRPLTNTMPKPLLPVGGTPLIVWNLLLLKRHGIRDVIINLHHLAPMIEQALGDGSKYGMRISYSRERVLLGTGGALKQVEGHFNGEPILVLNGDTLVEIDLEAVIAFHRARHAAATLVVRTDPDAASWGLVEIDDDQQVVRITGRGRSSPTLTHPRMFAGLHLLHPRLLRDIAKGQASSIIDAYIAAIQRGEPILGFEHQGYWSDIGTPQRYAQAEHDAATGLIQLSSRLPTVQPVR
ncbi:MAG: NDP-sugar synthase [Nitrospira sp.]|nr:NDP-sugar synthase [Nitrospira sp.]